MPVPAGFGSNTRKSPRGAQVTYSTVSPELIDAIHRWFDAQLTDHTGALPGLPEHYKE